MSGSEFFATIWVLCGVVFFFIAQKMGDDSESVFPFWLCLIAGPLIVAFMLIALPFIYLKDREEKRLRALEEEYELEQIEARRLAQEARDAEQRAKKAAKDESSRDFVRINVRLASQRIADGDTSKDLIELISSIAKHAKVIKKSQVSGEFGELIPVLRHGRINVYEALGDLPEATVKKVADDISAALKRLT